MLVSGKCQSGQCRLSQAEGRGDPGSGHGGQPVPSLVCSVVTARARAWPAPVTGEYPPVTPWAHQTGLGPAGATQRQRPHVNGQAAARPLSCRNLKLKREQYRRC